MPSGQPPPSHSSPACTRASQWFAVDFGSNRLPALSRRGHSPAGHSRRLPPFHSPRHPEALRSCGLLSPPSLLLRPHAPVSPPPTNFPGPPVISSALRMRDLPRIDHPPFGCCRHPYAGRPVACMYPTSSATALAIIHFRETWHLHSHRGAEHSVTGALSGAT